MSLGCNMNLLSLAGCGVLMNKSIIILLLPVIDLETRTHCAVCVWAGLTLPPLSPSGGECCAQIGQSDSGPHTLETPRAPELEPELHR